MEKHCNDSSAAEKFKDDDIDGSVFNEMSDDELREYLPKLGQRKKVQMMWAEYIANSTDSEGNTAADRTKTGCKALDGKMITQSIRPFDCPNSYRHKYLHGAFVPVSEARRGNPLCPVHTYLAGNRGILLSTKDTTALAVEIVKFGSACMNDKTNGTIHFGIACNGEIKGCSVDSKVFERKVTKCIRKSFYDGQISIALNCIRPPQFIEVIGENLNESLYVIEVDVVSSTKFVEDFAFFMKPVNDDESISPIYRYDKEMKCLKPREIDLYMKDEKNKLYLARKELEEIQLKHPDVNCFQRLKDFLCCGNEQFEHSIYPLLILNTVYEHENEHFEFMKHIQWRAVFDFNKHMENGNVREYLEKNHGMVFNVNFIEDFDPKKMKESTMKQTTDNLKSTSLPNWIYCNGPTQECNFIVDPTQWKMERSGSFRKAIEFYVDNIPQGRGRVIIPLFCNENSLLVEAAEEFFIKFRNSCLIITESETMSSGLREDLHRRNVFTSDSNIDNYFMIGLPWKQVNEAVFRFSPKTPNPDDVELQRSTGVPLRVPIVFQRELCDLGILAYNECCAIRQMDDETKEQFRRLNGENFYRGNTVSWPNFYFSDQVLQRYVHTRLVEFILEEAKARGNFNQPVREVAVYHQPGAGGSTTGRHVLWTLKDRFRCCVVENITKQTTAQINRLRLYGEDNANEINPVIVLLDIDDEEAVARLHDELNVESRKHNCQVYCVLLICCRVSEIPWTKIPAKVFLQQRLTDHELDWFNEKYKHMVEIHKNERGCDPNTLLSFNIMKENFNMTNISKYVKTYVQDPLLTKEHKCLLKYLSILNHYDIRFQPVPINCFDPIMGDLNWPLHLPQSIKVLVNPVTVHGVSGVIPCIRITNYLLSLPVLNAVLELSKELDSVEFSLTIGEVAKELLQSKLINQCSASEVNKKFERILTDIVKKRSFSHSGEKPKPFSLLVMTLFDAKDYDTSIDIIERIYEITDDPFVAQQLARFHAEIGNWEHAHNAIEQAMKQKHDNAYLTHTCGQIYKMQFEIICKDTNNFQEDDIMHALQIAQKSQFYFREAQRITRTENVSPQNPAGFDGEIRLSIELLKSFCIPDVVVICQRRMHAVSITKIVMTDCTCKFVNGLGENTLSAIESLQTEIFRMQVNPFQLHSDYVASLLENKQIKQYKRDFHKYFNRSMRKQTHEKTPISSFIDATEAKTETLSNVATIHESRLRPGSNQQNRIFLAASVELALRDIPINPNQALQLLKCSRYFYEKLSNVSFTCTLEAHLMIALLHWPLETKVKLRESLCSHSVLINVLESWKQIIDEKPAKTKHVDKMICFLSKDDKFPCIIRADKISKSNLYTIKGTVCSNGFDIDIKPYTFRTENIPPIRIQLLNQIKLSSMWNKPAEVFLGFGLYGPKADLLDNVPTSAISNSPRNRVDLKCSSPSSTNEKGVKSSEKTQKGKTGRKKTKQQVGMHAGNSYPFYPCVPNVPTSMGQQYGVPFPISPMSPTPLRYPMNPFMHSQQPQQGNMGMFPGQSRCKFKHTHTHTYLFDQTISKRVFFMYIIKGTVCLNVLNIDISDIGSPCFSVSHSNDRFILKMCNCYTIGIEHKGCRTKKILLFCFN